MRNTFFISLALTWCIFSFSGGIIFAQTSDCLSLSNTLSYTTSDTWTAGEVTKLQTFLKSFGFFSREPSGYFGPVTLQSVKAFQADKAIVPVSGIVGPITRATIQALTCGIETAPASKASTAPLILADNSDVLPGQASTSQPDILWQPIYASYFSLGGYGKWIVNGTSSATLSQSQTGPLHFRVIRSYPDLDTVGITAKVKFSDGVEVGVCGRMDPSGNGYCFSTGFGGGDQTAILMFMNNDQNPKLLDLGDSFPIKKGVTYDIRLQIIDNTIYGKVWRDGTKEPDAWMAEAQDNNYASGKIGLYTYNANASFNSIAYATRVVKSSVVPTPVVTSISPSSVLAGQQSMVSGKNFNLSSVVSIDGSPVSTTIYASSTALTFTAPVDISVGNHKLSVITNGIASASTTLTIAPAVTFANGPVTGSGGNSPTVTLPILVIRYFPLTSGSDPNDPTHAQIDITKTGDYTATLADARAHMQTIENELADLRTQGSIYHGYKDSSAAPSINYQIVARLEHFTDYPVVTSMLPTRRIDEPQILLDNDICYYVNTLGVRDVWLWANLPSLQGTSESRMSPAAGSGGEVANGGGLTLPQCGHTYILYNFNPGRGLAEAMESTQHQLEAEFLSFGSVSGGNLFDIYTTGSANGFQDTATFQANSCGWAHAGPNVVDPFGANQYDWSETNFIMNQCEDWKPDGTGAKKSINCTEWGCDEPGFQKWWMQNLPGLNNTLTYNGQKLRNFWDVVADYDTAYRNHTLFASVNSNLATVFEGLGSDVVSFFKNLFK